MIQSAKKALKVSKSHPLNVCRCECVGVSVYGVLCGEISCVEVFTCLICGSLLHVCLTTVIFVIAIFP